MEMTTAIQMAADRDTVFALAAAVEHWPRILPHYRSVRLLRDDGRRRAAEMAASRDGLPVRWTAVQELDWALGWRPRRLLGRGGPDPLRPGPLSLPPGGRNRRLRPGRLSDCAARPAARSLLAAGRGGQPAGGRGRRAGPPGLLA